MISQAKPRIGDSESPGQGPRSPVSLYRVFGLTVASELPLPGLVAGWGEPDVIIRFDSVPEHLPEPTGRGVLFEASPGRFLLIVDDTARYLARDGREVAIQIAPGADPRRLATFLLGTVFTALLHQRGTLVLHAAGIAGPNGAVLIAGNSGAGKSTLAAELASRGFQVLCDDAAAIGADERGGLIVHPGLPHLNLWKDAASRLGLDAVRDQAALPDLEKYVVREPYGFAITAQPLSAICIVEVGNRPDARTELLPDAERFSVIKEQTRHFRILNALRANPAHFQLAVQVAARVPMTRIQRPSRRDPRNHVADLVQAMLG